MQLIHRVAIVAALLACGCKDAGTQATFEQNKALLEKYCWGCHGTRVTGTARQGAPTHTTLDDADVLRLDAAHVREALLSNLPAGQRGSHMPPLGAPQPTAEELQRLTSWLEGGAKTQADQCARAFAEGKSNSRIVVTPTAGGSPTVPVQTMSSLHHDTPEFKYQQGSMVQGRFPVPVGWPLRIDLSTPPLGAARKTIKVEWLRDCERVEPPTGARVSGETIEWTPTWADLGDHVVKLGADGDEGREIVIAVRPDPPGALCHDNSGELQVQVEVAPAMSSTDIGARIRIKNGGAHALVLDEIVGHGVSTRSAPDVQIPVSADGVTLGPGETKEFTMAFCAYGSTLLPDRPARYTVLVRAVDTETLEGRCAFYMSDAMKIAAPEAALPGRDVPAFEEVASLLGLLNQDATGKSLLVGDFNQDGLFDFSVTNAGLGSSLFFALGDQFHYARQPDWVVLKGAGRAGTTVNTRNDGVLDLMDSTWPIDDNDNGTIVWGKADGRGGFNVSHELEPGTPVAGRNINVFDYDNDGFEDLYFTTWGGSAQHAGLPPFDKATNVLYHNQSDGTFGIVTAQAGAQGIVTATSLATLDANEDGWPDLFMGGAEPSIVLLNNGDGTFARKALDTSKWTFTGFNTWEVATFDFNADGHADVAEGEMFMPGFLESASATHVWIGDGAGNFKLEVDGVAGNGSPCLSWTMGMQAGDLNDDGYPDLFVGGGDVEMGWHHQLWINQTPQPGALPHFIDRTSDIDYPASGATRDYPYRSHGGTMMDLDGDLDLDFIQVNGGMGRGTFVPAREPWRIFLNRGTTNGKLDLDLQGFPSNRDATGARVDVTLTGGRGPSRLSQWVFPNNGFPGSSLRGRVHFGLFDATAVQSVRVTWPDGQVTEHAAMPNSRIPIKEKDLLRFGARFETGLDGFSGGGALRGRALCFDGTGGTASHTATAAMGGSAAFRLDFPDGSDGGQAGSVALTDGSQRVTLRITKGQAELSASGGGKATGNIAAATKGRRYLVRLEVVPGGSGATAIAYVDLKEVARLQIPALNVNAMELGGTGTCAAMASLR